MVVTRSAGSLDFFLPTMDSSCAAQDGMAQHGMHAYVRVQDSSTFSGAQQLQLTVVVTRSAGSLSSLVPTMDSSCAVQQGIGWSVHQGAVQQHTQQCTGAQQHQHAHGGHHQVRKHPQIIASDHGGLQGGFRACWDVHMHGSAGLHAGSPGLHNCWTAEGGR